MVTRDRYTVVPFPRERQIVVDGLAIGARRHVVHGLLEVDVTRARQFIREHKARTGETLSFTAFIVACLAHALSANRSVQAYRDWRNGLIIFDDVDVVVMIESEVNRVAIPHIVRAANRKSFRAIHDEIRAIQTRPAQSEQKSGWLMRLAPCVPGFVRRFFIWGLLKSGLVQAKFWHRRRDRFRNVRARWRLGIRHSAFSHARHRDWRNRGETRGRRWAHRNSRISRLDDQP